MGRIKKEEFEIVIPEVQGYIKVNNKYNEFILALYYDKELKIGLYIDSILNEQVSNYIYMLNNADYMVNESDGLRLYIENGEHISYQPSVHLLDYLDRIYVNLCEYSMFFIEFGDNLRLLSFILPKVDDFISLIKGLEAAIRDNPLLMYYIENNDYVYNIFELFECVYNKRPFKTLIYEPRAIQ